MKRVWEIARLNLAKDTANFEHASCSLKQLLIIFQGEA